MIQRTQHLDTTRRAPKRVRGLSLIEVLVAIALLTIGVLSVITLFPVGFLTLEIAANATNADRIGQRELEKLNTINSGQAAIIASIYSNYDSAIPAGTAPNAVPTLAPAGQPAYQQIPLGLNSDINAYRLVKGETVRVPPPVVYTPVGGTATTVSLYTPAFAPIIAPDNAPTANQSPGIFAVHSLPWSRRFGNSQGNATNYADPNALLSLNQPQYLIDYTNDEIALPQASYRQQILFQVTNVQGAVYKIGIVVEANVSGWINPYVQTPHVYYYLLSSPTVFLKTLPILPSTAPAPPAWVVGSDTLKRDFENMTGAGYNASNYAETAQDANDPYAPSPEIDPSGLDPYKFQMLIADQAGTTPAANLGTIAFNPVAASVRDTSGRPLMASVDYEVYDWHIISEDRSASSASGATSPAIRLSLRSLYSKTANDLFSDNTKYAGLFYGTPAGNNLDVTVLDLQKGIVLTQNTLAGAGNPGDFSVNYPDGVINIINQNEVNVPLRVFYRAREDWGVALSRAPSSYVLNDLPSVAYLPQYGECALDATNQVLYFPLADIGKTVTVAGLTGTVGTGMNPPSLPNIDMGLMTITKDPNYARGTVSIASTLPANTTLTTVAGGQSGTVGGSTVEAQVIWKEQGIWKHREITTVIPANATQMALHQ